MAIIVMAQNDCDLVMFKCTLHFHECFRGEEKQENRRTWIYRRLLGKDRKQEGKILEEEEEKRQAFVK